MLARQGAFEAGGAVLSDEKGTLSCDHGHVEYQIPVEARAVALFLWHSSSAKVWQARWDGGEGVSSIFLRRGFPVYLWDGPRVGRGNWGCESYSSTPQTGRDQANFVAWRFGAKFPEWFPGVQFPTGDPAAWEQATRARYDEFDIVKNAQARVGRRRQGHRPNRPERAGRQLGRRLARPADRAENHHRQRQGHRHL